MHSDTKRILSAKSDKYTAARQLNYWHVSSGIEGRVSSPVCFPCSIFLSHSGVFFSPFFFLFLFLFLQFYLFSFFSLSFPSPFALLKLYMYVHFFTVSFAFPLTLLWRNVTFVFRWWRDGEKEGEANAWWLARRCVAVTLFLHQLMKWRNVMAYRAGVGWFDEQQNTHTHTYIHTRAPHTHTEADAEE